MSRANESSQRSFANLLPLLLGSVVSREQKMPHQLGNAVPPSRFAISSGWTGRKGRPLGHRVEFSGLPTIRQREAESRDVQVRLSAENCITRALIDARGSAAIMPEEEPENPGGVRSQPRRCLLSADE